ncbi:MAG: phosphohistidine phosphatase SixA [Candidatus Krumholzibacteriales bacterium]
MAVYLVQHGRNLPGEQDPEKPLSPQGRREVEQVAGLAADYSVNVSGIEHSPKKRAKQTAQIFGRKLQPGGGVHQREGIKAMDEVAPVTEELDPGSDLMLVGHLPFMEKLSSYLITGRESPRVISFVNGGIVCLDRDDQGWFLKWTLLPEQEYKQ